MQIVKGKDETEILAIDDQDKVLGKGYLIEFEASDLYEKQRMNYFIDLEVEPCTNEKIIKDYLVKALIEKARIKRQEQNERDARVYHCCLVDDQKNRDYYATQEGFSADEAMHILKHDLSSIPEINSISYEFREDNLQDPDKIKEFIQMHSQVFLSHPYDADAMKDLKNQKGFKSMGIYDQDTLVANILLLVESDGTKEYGLVEDMVVSKAYRRKGLGEYLLIKGLEYFRALDLEESQLEVWSANQRAPKLYYKCGYTFLKETEISIGMNI